MTVLEQLRARLVRQGPSLLRIPLKFTPFALQRQLLQQVLSWQFRQALSDGDLEFLESRWLKIEVRDLALQWVYDGRKRQNWWSASTPKRTSASAATPTI